MYELKPVPSIKARTLLGPVPQLSVRLWRVFAPPSVAPAWAPSFHTVSPVMTPSAETWRVPPQAST